jgi:hypothetical protein
VNDYLNSLKPFEDTKYYNPSEAYAYPMLDYVKPVFEFQIHEDWCMLYPRILPRLLKLVQDRSPEILNMTKIIPVCETGLQLTYQAIPGDMRSPIDTEIASLSYRGIPVMMFEPEEPTDEGIRVWSKTEFQTQNTPNDTGFLNFFLPDKAQTGVNSGVMLTYKRHILKIDSPETMKQAADQIFCLLANERL